MSKITLIYFEGCPNAGRARQVLQELGADFETFDQTQLPEGDSRRNFASPTILRDGVVIFGTAAKGGGCSTETIDVDTLKRALIQK